MYFPNKPIFSINLIRFVFYIIFYHLFFQPPCRKRIFSGLAFAYGQEGEHEWIAICDGSDWWMTCNNETDKRLSNTIPTLRNINCTHQKFPTVIWLRMNEREWSRGSIILFIEVALKPVNSFPVLWKKAHIITVPIKKRSRPKWNIIH